MSNQRKEEGNTNKGDSGDRKHNAKENKPDPMN
jgi:hypothetical protein